MDQTKMNHVWAWGLARKYNLIYASKILWHPSLCPEDLIPNANTFQAQALVTNEIEWRSSLNTMLEAWKCLEEPELCAKSWLELAREWICNTGDLILDQIYNCKISLSNWRRIVDRSVIALTRSNWMQLAEARVIGFAAQDDRRLNAVA